MRTSQQPLSFEQEYPKHEFAPLVDLGLKAASWAAGRRSNEPPDCEYAGPRASRIAPIPLSIRHRPVKFTAVALVVMFVLAATFTRAYADCPAAEATNSLTTAPVDREKVSGLTRTSEALRKAIESAAPDGLDTYNEDLQPPAGSLASLADR